MNIAILGLGTVGTGACEAAARSEAIKVRWIFVRPGKKVSPEYQDLITSDIDDIINDPEVDVVCECMGGESPAYEYVMAAMKHGKHVVTPNKGLVSAHYRELVICAKENNVALRFTSSAGGGIPWLFNLLRTKRCDTVTRVWGILNGTCNYILDTMHREGSDFDQILKSAQELGYAEKDPTADIEGIDTLRKCVISGDLAFDEDIDPDSVPAFGISTITAKDISWFKANGYVCRLIMSASRQGDSVSAYVEPTLFKSDSLEAGTGANNNLVSLEAEELGVQSFYGQGAGKAPTGSSVIQDVIDIDTGTDMLPGGYYHLPDESTQVDNSACAHRYYIHIGNNCQGFPFQIVEEQEEDKDGFYLVTRPVPVSQAHSIAEEFRSSGSFFMAGIQE